MDYRELGKADRPAALDLVWRVFLRDVAPGDTQEGIDEFYNSIHDESYLRLLRIYGAVEDGTMRGVIATRNNDTHIVLFFVDGDCQGQGIGRELFALVAGRNDISRLTVHASPQALPVYRRLGFRETAPQQEANGLRYTPMEYRKGKRSG